MSLMTDEHRRALPMLLHPLMGQSWENAFEERMPLKDRMAIGARFITSGLEPFEIIAMTEQASRETAQEREKLEHVNIGRLGLSAHEVRQFEQRGNDRRINTAGFLHQLGVWAIVANPVFYDLPNAQNRGYKYAFELFGSIQNGNWDSTKHIDDAIRRLPAQVAEDYPTAGIETYTDKQKCRLGYRYEPMNVQTAESNHYMDHGFGRVRRRRAVADLTFHNLGIPVGVFKESTALVGVGLLDKHEKEILRERAVLGKVLEKEGRTPNIEEMELVSAANQIAGEHFETGIEEAKGETKIIVPTSSHYVGRVVVPYLMK